MKLERWSDLLYMYFFARSNSTQKILHITLQDLVDYAKNENVNIAGEKKASEFSDIVIKNDFISKFWLKPRESNKSVAEFLKKIIELKQSFINDHYYQGFLTIIAIFIMPICENDDLEVHGNEYYSHLQKFIYDNGFITSEKRELVNNILREINLDEIWQYIDLLAQEESLPYKSRFSVAGNNAKGYVRSLMKESLLSPSRIQKLCIVFDKGGFVPDVNIENQRLLSAFSQHYSHIGISESKYKRLINKDFKDYLINVLRAEYDNWNGSTIVKERDTNSNRDKISSGNTCYPLLLHMDYNELTNQMTFKLILYCPDNYETDEIQFVSDNDNKEFPAIYINNNGYANRAFDINYQTLYNTLKDKQGVYGIHQKDNESVKCRFVTTDYYLMKLYQNKYVASKDFIKGESYFVIIRNSAIESFQQWLNSNSAEPINEIVFNGLYSVFHIRQAVEDLSFCNNLRFKTEIKCSSVNNIEIKTKEDTDVVCLSKYFPAQFNITGIDVKNDRVYAVFDILSSELHYNHDKGLWILNNDTIPLNIEFQIFVSEKQIPYSKKYKFIEFVLPQQFNELPLDKWGSFGKDTLITGLTLPDQVIKMNLVNWHNLKTLMAKSTPKPIENNEYTETDYLLYAITSASFNSKVITLDWLKRIKDRLLDELNDSNEGKYTLYNTLAEYFRMGYINYAYTEKGLCLTANHPSLVLLAPEFERHNTTLVNGKNMVSISCVDNRFKTLLTGGRTPLLVQEISKLQSSLNFQMEVVKAENALMPQTIFIYADNRDIFKHLADKCNLNYQNNVYANALLETLPSINDYIEDKIENGIEKDYSLVNNFRAINYKTMAEKYPQKLAEGRGFYNYEIDKKTYDENNDVVTFFQGTKDEATVMIKDNKMTEIDKYWGHFVGMLFQNAKVLQYNVDQSKIFLPLQIRLPLLYARALTLITGKTPSSVSGSRAYNVVHNPFTDACKADTIRKKLGQL